MLNGKWIFIIPLLIIALSCNLQAQFLTYQDIEGYQKECYADSFQVEIHIGDIRFCWILRYDNYDFETSDCTNPEHHNELVWKHKQPTFEGFIEYVNRIERKFIKCR